MKIKDIEKEFKKLSYRQRKSIVGYMQSLNEQFNFKSRNGNEMMQLFFKSLDCMLSDIKQVEKPFDQINIEDFIVYELIFKLGVIAGLMDKFASINLRAEQFDQIISKN